MSNSPKVYLEQLLRRPLRTGSLGSVDVSRESGRWAVRFDPPHVEDVVRPLNKDGVRRAIATWAQARQDLMGLDIGSYTLSLPKGFGSHLLREDK